MNREHMSDDLHRVVKLAMDSGEMSTLDEAERLFAGYRLVLEIGPDVASSPTLQAAARIPARLRYRQPFMDGQAVSFHLKTHIAFLSGTNSLLQEYWLEHSQCPKPSSSCEGGIPRRGGER